MLGVAGLGPFEDGVDVQRQAVADPGELVVFDHDEGQAVLEGLDGVVAEDDFGAGAGAGAWERSTCARTAAGIRTARVSRREAMRFIVRSRS